MNYNNLKNLIASGIAFAATLSVICFGFYTTKKAIDEDRVKREELKNKKDSYCLTINLSNTLNDLCNLDKIDTEASSYLYSRLTVLVSQIKNATTEATLEKSVEEYKRIETYIHDKNVKALQTLAFIIKTNKEENERELCRQHDFDIQKNNISALTRNVTTIASAIRQTVNAPEFIK